MLENKIKQIVQNNLKDAKVFIHDMTGENNHFNLLVISDELDGMTVTTPAKQS